jgi:predicted nucleic acid-binding protein
MTVRVVIDASAAANIVMRTDIATPLIDKLEKAALVIAPELFHSEIANTMWKYVQIGDLNTSVAIDRYQEAIGLIDTFEADKGLITEALSSASKYNHPVYDLLYAVLALRYGCSILSSDKRLIILLKKMHIDLA